MRRNLVAITTALLTAALLATAASAELSQKGDLFVRFDGDISPSNLPRATRAPIGVRIEGRIRAPKGKEPPALRHIRVALNRGGHLSSRGLPLCRLRQVDSVTSAKALGVCGETLVGTGSITAHTSFPDQPAYLLRGEILLFNARADGHKAIIAHIFQREPAPITRYIIFHITHQPGTFGTVISGEVPPEINRNGYLTSISLQLQRNYVLHGKPKAYLSAACSAPAGIEVAGFPFARASMRFEDGRTLASTLTRTCRVKG